MLENELSTIELCGKEYPYKCSMVVLEKIQKAFGGDVLAYERGIRGLKPYFDAETGIRDKAQDVYTVPDVDMTVRSLVWMIEEGLEISGIKDMKAPTVKEIMRQGEYTVNDLALKVFDEYAKCFLLKKGKAKTPPKAMNRRRRKRKK